MRRGISRTRLMHSAANAVRRERRTSCRFAETARAWA